MLASDHIGSNNIISRVHVPQNKIETKTEIKNQLQRIAQRIFQQGKARCMSIEDIHKGADLICLQLAFACYTMRTIYGPTIPNP
jgi:citrate lyase synthetase